MDGLLPQDFGDGLVDHAGVVRDVGSFLPLRLDLLPVVLPERNEKVLALELRAAVEQLVGVLTVRRRKRQISVGFLAAMAFDMLRCHV